MTWKRKCEINTLTEVLASLTAVTGSIILAQYLPRSLSHWSQVTHICVGNLIIIGSDNGLSPGRRQAITWITVGILLIGTLGTKFSEMLIEIHTLSFKEIHLIMSSGKWRPFCLGLNVLLDGISWHSQCVVRYLEISSVILDIIIWPHNMMTSSNGNDFRVTGPLCGEFTGPGEFPAQRPVTRSFDVSFDLRLNKALIKQACGLWFETLLWSL